MKAKAFKPRTLLHPRDAILRTMERIYRYRMTTTSGGNLSIRDENGDLWITPTRVDKGSLRREDIVCVRADGRREGAFPPSSELPFHQAIYQRRPDLGAIVHAHAVALVAFSVCGRVPNTRLFPQAHHVCGEGGFAPYALPGSARLGGNIANTFAKGFNCVVLENHGVVCAGENLSHAFERFETFEFTAKTIIKASQLGKARYLSDRQLQKARVRPMRSFERSAGTEEEMDLRRQLADFMQRGYRQRLFISTEGSFSARLNDGAMLITPSRLDRSSIAVEDLVLVRDGRAEKGRLPSRAARLHSAIYRRQPKVRSIVSALPVNATAFSVTRAAFESRTIPESYYFLQDVSRIQFGEQWGDGEAAAARMSMKNPIALIDNDGVLVCGTSVLDAFDRLEVLETTAEALINSRPLGPITRLSAEVIAELMKAFPID
ncbi:MAG TPA: class II aldolase/adducin family protein [Verrucomicrobiae bacterium]|nr:class II aldolase/adducin family protein [Verrucomicrobiae bacterium]